MRKIGSVIMALALASLFAAVPRIGHGDEKVYKLGDKGPAGGFIFYDKGNSNDGWRYLEAAPKDQSTGVSWSGGKGGEINARDTAIGRGVVNTRKIVEAQRGGKYAAKICADLKLGGKDDWFLPSKDELDLMYRNLKDQGLGGMTGKYYWSSSEVSPTQAWKQAFHKGEKSHHVKREKLNVRAARAF